MLVDSKKGEGGKKYFVYTTKTNSKIYIDFDLLAASTFFQPRKRSGTGCTTYMPKDRDQPATQIDYAFVSRRWASSVKNCSVIWATSMHRFGRKYDHGMVQMVWKFRVKKLVL